MFKQKKIFTVAVIALSLMAVSLFIFNINSTHAQSYWNADYFNNRDLEGVPVLSRQETAIDHHWGGDSPAAEVAADNFSARWQRTVNFTTAGTYRFYATMDDGMRVWVNDALIIDEWIDGPERTIEADLTLPTGNQTIRVEYYESGGEARAGLTWSLLSDDATATPTPPSTSPPATTTNWRGEYFNNMELAGTPVLVRDDVGIGFDWGTGSPEPGVVNTEQFSARWTRTLDFTPGRYRFSVTTDDGVRVWVNNVLVLDEWKDQTANHIFELDIGGGPAPIRMEYYENLHEALAFMSWERIGEQGAAPPSGSPATSSWRGEYFDNMSLSGSPVLARNDAQINFDWGYGSPSPGVVGVDHFSVRWTRDVEMNAGWYRFSATVDDGVRVWVNDNLIIDQWNNGAARTFTGEVNVPAGVIPVQVAYYEDTLLASVQVSWTQISGPSETPPNTGGPTLSPTTAVVTGGPLNVRTGPGRNYNVIDSLAQGWVVDLTGYRNADATWVQLNTPNGFVGWSSTFYLEGGVPFTDLPVWDGQTPLTNWGTAAPTGRVVNAYFLNMRSGPGLTYPVVSVLPNGQVVELTGYRNADASWVQVRLPDNTVGWVNGSYLQSDTVFSTLTVWSE